MGFAQFGDLVRLDGDGEGPGALEVAIEAEVGDRALDLVEVLVAEACRVARARQAKRFSPLTSPWVSVASTNPPLRPEAAQPMVLASSSATRIPGVR